MQGQTPYPPQRSCFTKGDRNIDPGPVFATQEDDSLFYPLDQVRVQLTEPVEGTQGITPWTAAQGPPRRWSQVGALPVHTDALPGPRPPDAFTTPRLDAINAQFEAKSAAPDNLGSRLRKKIAHVLSRIWP